MDLSSFDFSLYVLNKLLFILEYFIIWHLGLQSEELIKSQVKCVILNMHLNTFSSVRLKPREVVTWPTLIEYSHFKLFINPVQNLRKQ